MPNVVYKMFFSASCLRALRNPRRDLVGPFTPIMSSTRTDMWDSRAIEFRLSIKLNADSSRTSAEHYVSMKLRAALTSFDKLTRTETRKQLMFYEKAASFDTVWDAINAMPLGRKKETLIDLFSNNLIACSSPDIYVMDACLNSEEPFDLSKRLGKSKSSLAFLLQAQSLLLDKASSWGDDDNLAGPLKRLGIVTPTPLHGTEETLQVVYDAVLRKFSGSELLEPNKPNEVTPR